MKPLPFLTAIVAVSSSLNAVTIDWVSVGDINNPADPATGYGAVDHIYQISSTEVSIGEFLTAYNDDSNVGSVAQCKE